MATLTKQKADITQFIKDAFCIDGTVEIVYEEKTFRSYIKCCDAKRGEFNVAFESEAQDANSV